MTLQTSRMDNVSDFTHTEHVMSNTESGDLSDGQTAFVVIFTLVIIVGNSIQITTVSILEYVYNPRSLLVSSLAIGDIFFHVFFSVYTSPSVSPVYNVTQNSTFCCTLQDTSAYFLFTIHSVHGLGLIILVVDLAVRCGRQTAVENIRRNIVKSFIYCFLPWVLGLVEVLCFIVVGCEYEHTCYGHVTGTIHDVLLTTVILPPVAALGLFSLQMDGDLFPDFIFQGGTEMMVQISRHRNMAHSGRAISSTKQTPAAPATSTEQTPAAPATSTEQTPATPATSTEQTPATPATSTEQTPAALATSTEQTPAALATSTEQTPAAPVTSTEQTPAAPATSTEQTPAAPATSTEQTPETLATSTEQTPTTPATCTDQTTSTLATSTEQTPETLATSTEQTPTTPATSTDQTPATPATCTDQTTSTLATSTDQTSATPATCTEQTPATLATSTDQTSETPATCTEQKPTVSHASTQDELFVPETCCESTSRTCSIFASVMRKPTDIMYIQLPLPPSRTATLLSERIVISPTKNVTIITNLFREKKQLLFVFFVYCICALPYTVLYFSSYSSTNFPKYTVIEEYFKWLARLRVLLTPFVWWCLSKKQRRSY